MGIVTKTGDDGSTGLLFGKRAPKTALNVAAYGAVDELSAALGLARAALGEDGLAAEIEKIQNDLVGLMGELATLEEDRARYLDEGYLRIGDDDVMRLETMVSDMESKGIQFRGWALPGDSEVGARLDMARTVCRRAEREVLTMFASRGPVERDGLLGRYLNRLSDALWIFARRWEHRFSEDGGRPSESSVGGC